MKRTLKPDGYVIPIYENVSIEENKFYVGALNSEIRLQINNDETVKTGKPANTMLSDMIIRTDSRGKILGIETSHESATVARRQERLVGQHMSTLFPPDIAAIHAAELKKALHKRHSPVYTYEMKITSDQAGHYETRIIRGIDNEVTFIIRDITGNRYEKLSLIRGLIEGEEKERKRVAQELHDGLGQIISALYMQVGTLSKKPGVGEYLEAPMRLIADIISEYRAISHNLMPPILEGAGLPGILKVLCERINATGYCQVFFHSHKFKSKPDKYVIRELYRICQELMNNALKHSGCSIINVELIEGGGLIRIVIADNGKGFDISQVKRQTKGIGLKNISTRLELIGGALEFDSLKNKGTIVTISIPRPSARAGALKKNRNGFNNN